MQVALRERDFDLVGGKGFIDGAIQFVLHASPVCGIRNPAEKLEVQAGVTEQPEPRARSRAQQHIGIVRRNLLQCLDDMIDITAISDAYCDADAVLRWRSSGLIDDRAVSDDAIGDRYFDIVAGEDS